MDPTPTPTFIPLKMTGIEEWIESLKSIWADPYATWPHKLLRTLTDPGVMLVIFVLVGVIALIGTKIATKLKGSEGDVSTAAETSAMPTTSTSESTEI